MRMSSVKMFQLTQHYYDLNIKYNVNFTILPESTLIIICITKSNNKIQINIEIKNHNCYRTDTHICTFHLYNDTHFEENTDNINLCSYLTVV